MQNTPLHAVLAAVSSNVVERFVADVRSHELPPRPLTRAQVINHLQEYLLEIADALRPGAPVVERSATAEEHGEQRWYVGYDLKTVLLEYGVLRRAILTELEHARGPLTAREFDRIVQLLNVGIADAAREFMTKATMELDVALAEARAATRAREDVLAVVTHDLRTPLQVVQMSASLIPDACRRGETAAVSASVTRITRATARMDTLIRSILDLARIRAGEMPLSLEDHQADDVLREACVLAEPLAEHEKVRLELGSTGSGLVRCDRERILQVLSNLIGNAIKFSPEGGRVTLTASSSQGTWTFSIRDLGPGVPSDKREHLFDRFWHGGHKKSGTGLGLTIAKALVELHGGRIWVESEPDAGSTFSFTIPNVQRTEQHTQ